MRNLFLVFILLFFSLTNLYSQNCSINAGTSSTYCKGELFTLFGTKAGLFPSATTTSKWSQVSGAACIINSPDSLITTVNAFAAGTYVFRLSIKCLDGINTEDLVTVTILPLTIADAGRDTAFCPFGVLNLSGNNIIGTSETGAWTLVGSNTAGVTIVSPTNPTSVIKLNPNITGTSTIRWTIRNSNGCNSFDDVSITNIGGIEPVNAGPDQTLSGCFSLSTCTDLLATNGGSGLNGQLGTWSFISGPSIPTFSSKNSRSTKICNLFEGTYVIRYTAQGPCANGFDEVIINVPKPTQNISSANPGSNKTFCGLIGTITLNGNVPLYADESVLWTQLSGLPTTITTPNNPSTTVTGFNTAGNYCFNYKVNNNNTGCSSNNTVCYSIFESGTVDGGSDIILPCNLTTAAIPTRITGTGEVKYRIISGPAGAFIYPTGYGTSNNISGLNKPGTYRIEINYSSGFGCPAVNDFVDIVVSRSPVASNAGTDQNFACTSITTQLAGNDPTVTGLGTGIWSQISGPNTANLPTPRNNICDVKGTIPGKYTFRWTISGGNNCPDNFDDMTVIIPDTSITRANAGTDKVVCYNSPIELKGNSFRVDETAKWTTLSNGISFIPDNTSSTVTATGFSSANTRYVFIYTITNSCDISANDTIIITTNGTLGPSVANAGADVCLTDGNISFNLNSSNPASGTGIWSQISGPASSITNISQTNTSVVATTTGDYQYLWTVSAAGCNNYTADTVLITVSDSTINADAGVDKSICANTYTLIGNNPVTGKGIWSQISGDGSAIINTPANSSSAVTNLKTGTYTFRWTIYNGACPSSFDDIIINVSTPPSLSNAGSDLNLCGINAISTTLNAIVPISGSGQWVQVTGPNTAIFANNLLNNTMVSGLTNGQYKFRWIVTGGPNCPQSNDDIIVNTELPANAGNDQYLCNLSAATLSGNIGSSGIWTQISGPATTVTQIPYNNSRASVSGLITNTTYTFRYTIPASIFGCPSTFDDVDVNNGSATLNSNAGADSVYCNVTSFGLDGNIPGNGETGTWSVLSAPNVATFSPNANTPNARIINATSGTYLLKWTISNNTCSSSDIKRVDNYAIPTIANAGINQTVCFNTATLHGNIPIKGNGIWSQISGPNTTVITSINNPTSTVTGLSNTGTYQYVWTIANGPVCSVTKDTVQFTVTSLSPTIANAGIDQNLCNQTSINLTANEPITGVGKWYKISGGNANIVSPNSSNTVVNSLSTGNYDFIWKITNNDSSCSSYDTVRINNSVAPNPANAGYDDTFCVFSNILLHANNAIAGTSGIWSFISGPTIPTFISPNNPLTQVVGLMPGKYHFMWTISSPFCNAVSDEVSVTIINDVNLSIAGINQNICGTSLMLNANSPTNPNKAQWLQINGPNIATITSPSMPNTIINNLITGDYRFAWKIFNERCYSIDSLNLTISTPAIINAGADFSMCNNVENAQLLGAYISGSATSATWSIISGNGHISNTTPTAVPNIVTYTPNPVLYGETILRLTTNDPPGICPAITDDLKILIKKSGALLKLKNDTIIANLNTPVTIPVLSNDIIYEDNPLTLCGDGAIASLPKHGTATVNNDGTITYTIDLSFAGTDSFQYQICEICDAKGTDSAWVFIYADEGSFAIPNAFSPNNDGINDQFVIPFENADLTVWNVWGISVYENEHYNNNWDGTYNGAPLPDGTYYYTLNYKNDKDEIFNKTGFVTLHR